jgi:poly-beta-hydroxyalkanoate depolymerase
MRLCRLELTILPRSLWLVAFWFGLAPCIEGVLHIERFGDLGQDTRVTSYTTPSVALASSAVLMEEPVDPKEQYQRPDSIYEILCFPISAACEQGFRNEDAASNKRIALLRNHLIGLPPPQRA